MFLHEFGLSVHPFGISPRLDFLYKSGAFEESIAHLVYGLDNSEAIVLITGAIGTGKTMAVQSFLSYLGDRYVTALVTNTSVDAKELLKLVLEDLGVPLEPNADKSDLLIAFKRFLIASGREGRRIIVVVDEAQNLSREALEEIRLLTNLGQGDDQPVQIVLVGQPELEAALQRPDLAQLRQRIRVHYKLAPLSRRELEEYVDHRMTVAGGSGGVFAKAALDRIYERSGGVPRVVNTLCGEALLAAYVAGRRKVEARDLEDQSEAAGALGSEAPPESAKPAAGPLEPPSAPAMAVRRGDMAPAPEAPRVRESKPAAGPPASAMSRRRTATRRPRSARRGWIAALFGIVVIVIAALAASGRLDSFWARLRPSASADLKIASPAEAETRLPAPGPVPVDESRDGAAEVVAPAGADSSGAVEPALDPAPAVVQAGDTASSKASPEIAEGKVDSDSAPSAPDGEFYVHVSSFRTPEQAASAARKLTESGFLSTVHRQVIRDVQWYRVYMGPFGSHDGAVRLANRLREEGTITYYKVLQLDDDGS